MRDGVAVARGFAVGVGMRLDLSHYLPKSAIDAPIHSLHRWPRRTTIAWAVGLGLAGLAVLAALLPVLIAARYVAAGEAALDGAAGDATRAADSFQQALLWSPNDPEIHRALAEAYLRLEQPQKAIDTLEQAFRLQPESLLIRQELAAAYEAGGQLQRADGLWAALGMTPNDMLQNGDNAFGQRDFATAHAWYARATRVQSELPFDQVFKHAIAATLVGAADAPALLDTAQQLDHTFSIYPLAKRVRIEGLLLRWVASEASAVAPGTPLSYGSKRTVGTFWWSGEALAIVSVSHPGPYTLNVRVRHSKPAPVQMAVGIDGQRLLPIALARGDDSWQTIATPVHFSRGLHTINVWFLNNAIVEGVDRDAAIDWVAIEEDQP
jgi:Tetratricopeptide repeat/Ca-dependent carbohydrate-binding module xylan-binding